MRERSAKSELEAARQTVKFFEAVLRASQDGIVITDAAQNIVLVNEAFCAVFGKTRQDLDETGLHAWLKLLDGGAVNCWAQLEKSVRKGGACSDVEFQMTIAQGVRHLSVSASLLERVADEEPGIVVSIWRDVSDRKKAEEKLRESEEQHRALAENATDVIWTMDMALNFTYVSPSTERLIGYTPEEEIEIGLEGIFPPESLELAAKVYEKGLAREKSGKQHNPYGSMTVELDHIHKDGHIVPTEVRMAFLRDNEGKPRGILGITRDITQRKQAEKELQQSRQSYQLLIESLNDGVMVIDIETMLIVYSNKRGARLCGYASVDEFIGTRAMDHVHADHREAIIKAFSDNIHEEQRQRYELKLTGKDSDDRWVSVLATRMEFNERPAVLISASNITELKESEEERGRIEQQLHLAGRLAAVGELAAGVAHEVNNPLAAVQAYAQFLSERDDLDDAAQADVAIIYREAKRASKVTGNLLSFARQHQPERKLVSINDIVEKSLELHAYRMKVNNIELVIELQLDLPETMADYHQLQEVFVNLVGNAEQAVTETPGGGRIVVRTESEGKVVRITVADDGPGIAEEHLGSIFDPFFTTKQVGEGTGLGLGICYGIIKEHGGKIFVDSKPGQGATFTVEIPIVSEAEVVSLLGVPREIGP